jgi:hypothetical protein
MTEPRLNLEISNNARLHYLTMGVEERRRVDALFDHLRNWPNDPSLRALARRLDSEEEFLLETSSAFAIFFKVQESKVTILGIFAKDTLNEFAAKFGVVHS